MHSGWTYERKWSFQFTYLWIYLHIKEWKFLWLLVYTMTSFQDYRRILVSRWLCVKIYFFKLFFEYYCKVWNITIIVIIIIIIIIITASFVPPFTKLSWNMICKIFLKNVRGFMVKYIQYWLIVLVLIQKPWEFFILTKSFNLLREININFTLLDFQTSCCCV